MLSTPSSKERFDFSGRQELYTAYIPWAVAFDCADEWAEKYRTEMGGEPPVPAYSAAPYAGVHAGGRRLRWSATSTPRVSSAISLLRGDPALVVLEGGGGGGSQAAAAAAAVAAARGEPLHRFR